MNRTWVLGVLGLLAAGADAAELEVQVLDREGRPLPEAVVVLESSVAGARPQPKAELTIAQDKFKFIPAVSVAHVSSKVVFVNQDRVDHHVRGGVAGPGGVYLDPSQGYAFRLAGAKGGKPGGTETRGFNQPGPQLLGCHLHGSMRGHLYVTDSPWAAVTDAQGKVKLAELLVGPARVKVWHGDELVETPVQSLQIAEGMKPLQIRTQVQVHKKRAGAGSPYDY